MLPSRSRILAEAKNKTIFLLIQLDTVVTFILFNDSAFQKIVFLLFTRTRGFKNG